MKSSIIIAVFAIQGINFVCFSQEQASRQSPAEIHRLMNPHSGRILSIADGMVTIDKGSKDGIASGMYAEVEATKIIGDRTVNISHCIKIIEVRDFECTGIIRDRSCVSDTPGASGEVVEGMLVRYGDSIKSTQNEERSGRVLLAGGVFHMGCVEGDVSCQAIELPGRVVTIPAFYMDKTEVTLDLYAQCVEAKACPKPTGHHQTDSKYNWGNPDNMNHPINGVTWYQAKAYCLWAGGRLPAEVEWEYAARSGHPEWIFPWGIQASHDQANYGAMECCGGERKGNDRWEYTAPVGSFPPNAHGLYDVAGNVWEWVDDCYSDKNEDFSTTRSKSQELNCSKRTIRGGAWYGPANSLRISSRAGFESTEMHAGGGFRCAQSLDDTTEP